MALASALACKPPIEENTAPRVEVLEPESGTVVNLGTDVTIRVDVVDRDGDAPIQVSVSSSIDGPLLELEAATEAEVVEGTLTGLSAGRHDLTVVVDDGKTEGQRSVVVGLQVNAGPSEPGITVEPAEPTHTVDLLGTVSRLSEDPEGDAIGYAWTWSRNGVAVRTGGGQTALLSADDTEPGDVWTVEFEAYEAVGGVRKADGLAAAAMRSVTVVNDPPPAPTAVRVVPARPSPLQDLRCVGSAGIDPNGDPVVLTYAWEEHDGAGWVPLAGATSPSLPAQALLAGASYRCSVRASDGAASSDAVTVEATVREAFVTLDDADLLLEDSGGRGVAPIIRPFHLDDQGGADGLVVAVTGAGEAWFYELGAITTSASGAWPSPGLAVAAPGLTGLGTVPDVETDKIPDLLLAANDARTLWVMRTSLLDFALPAPAIGVASTTITADNDTWFEVFSGGSLSTNRKGDVAARQRVVGRPERVVVLRDDRFATVGPPTLKPGAVSGCVQANSLDEAFGVAIDATADATGDGTSDILIARRLQGGTPPADPAVCAYLFSGIAMTQGTAKCPVDDTPTTANDAFIKLIVDPAAGGCDAVAFQPDLDGDLRAELWAAAAATSTIGLFSSNVGPTGFVTLDATADGALLTIVGDDLDAGLGRELVMLGDLGSDGLPEVAVLEAAHDDADGVLYLFDGATIADAAGRSQPGSRPTLGPADARWTLEGTPTAPIRTVGPAFDVDGDGLLDLLLGTPDGTVGAWFSGG